MSPSLEACDESTKAKTHCTGFFAITRGGLCLPGTPRLPIHPCPQKGHSPGIRVKETPTTQP